MADNIRERRAALPNYPNDFATFLYQRFHQQRVPSDLDEAIKHYRAALLLHTPDHATLNNLGTILKSRFHQRGFPSDLDEAIELFRTALLLHPLGPDRSATLNNLGTSLQVRFRQRSVPCDLDESLENHLAALLLLPPDHPNRPMSLNNIAISLQDRFKQRGDSSDLDKAIVLDRAALFFRPPGHPERSIPLPSLALGLQYRFQQRGVPSDLDEAIELYRAALFLHPRGPNRSVILRNLGHSLHWRFEQRSVPRDLDESLENSLAALLLLPHDHADRPSYLDNIAFGLRDRFKQRGDPSDLDNAIVLDRAALFFRPSGHPDRSMSLNNLALDIRDRFQQRGVPSDLDYAIELNRAALLLRPAGHPDRFASLNNLALDIRARFQQRGVPFDLDEAIEHNRAALLLCPPGHPDRSMSLDNLAMSFRARFILKGVPSDLDDAVELNRAALLLRPLGHAERSGSLNDLACTLGDRFHQRGIPSDLDEAIEHNRAALLLRPLGHAERSESLNDLACTLGDRFHQRGIPSDLDEAIEHNRAALLLRPLGHPDRSTSLDNLAMSFKAKFMLEGVPSDLDEVFQLFLQLSHLSHAASRTDLSVAKSWAAFADNLKHDSALLAYKTALKFLDQRVALLSSSSRHFDVIGEAISSLAIDAFSCSVRHGALTTAVELVEQGRAVFWTQLARFSTPLDELSVSGDTGAALTEEFKRLSFRLRNTFDRSTEDQSSQIRQLTMQWDGVVSRIRMLPDFSRFLLPPLFSDLQKAAEEGPAIIVNASRYSCDALIVLSGQDPVHVPLDIAQTEVSKLSSEFQFLSEQFGSSDHQHKLVGILRKLWDHIVHPVVQALGEFKVHPRSRIWWCPTAEFTLLPLHAAGPYEKNKDNLCNIYISSYTPTLATLIRARQRVSQHASTQHFVAIGQGKPDTGKELQCVAPELAAVAKRLESVVSFTSLEDDDATVQGALDALNHNQWLHLSCHGMPNRQQPFESSFAMRDGPLMIKDIIQSNWHNPEFAFLSACHTTVGDEKSPDESIHLAAAMQFSGFRSVIGSMWSVHDDVALQVASAFYGYLVDGSGRLDCTRAAVALHKAMRSLRKKIPLEQQIVFVHIGV